MLRRSRAGHLMVPLLPDSTWECHDLFVPSEFAGPLVFSTYLMNQTFSVKRLPGSRTIRDLMIASGRGSFQRLHRAFRRLRQTRATGNEHDFLKREEKMESDLMDAEGSLHQKPRDVCVIEEVMNAEGSLHQKPRDACVMTEVVMDTEGSLHQKPRLCHDRSNRGRRLHATEVELCFHLGRRGFI